MISAHNAVRQTRSTPAPRRALRFVPRRRHRSGSRACDDLRIFGDAAGACPVGQHKPLQPENRGVPRRGGPFFRGRPRGRLRLQQDSTPDRHAFGRQTVGRRGTDAVGGPHKSRRRGRSSVSPRYREIKRHRRSGRAHAQRAQRPDRSERRHHPRRPAGQSPVAHGEPGRQDLARKKGAGAEHCRGTIHGRSGRSDRSSGCCRIPEALRRVADTHCDGRHRAERRAAVSGKQPRRHRRMGAQSSRRRCLSRVQTDALRCANAGTGGGAVDREPRGQLLRALGTRHDYGSR